MPTESVALAESVPSIRAGGCAGCTLCCKVLAVPTLAKPANTWCAHCKAGIGCGIYETRPAECAAFVCGYLALPDLPESWKPLTSRLILDTQSVAGVTLVYVDPARPDAWRRQPYYGTLQAWARQGLPNRMRIIVRIGRRNIVILPDHAVDIGPIEEDEAIVVLSPSGAAGRASVYQVYVAPKEAWAALGTDITYGRLVPTAADGFRTGTRLD